MRRPLPLLICFLIPLLIFCGGLGFATWVGFRAYPKLVEVIGAGEVPNGFSVVLPQPMPYTLWATVKHSENEERVEERSEEIIRGLLAGGRLYVFDEASGREIERSNWVPSVRYQKGERSVSLGSFSSNRVNQEVFIKGSGLTASLAVTVTPTNSGRTMQLVFTLVGIVITSLSIALIVFFALLHHRKKALEGTRRRI
ncbi:MAG: hypothetical protein AAGC68_01150 [Verrucomicrobiota bacterium]